MEEDNRRLRAEIDCLRARLRAIECGGGDGAGNGGGAAAAAPPAPLQPPPLAYVTPHGLTKAQAERYSRQLVLPAFGAAAQARLLAGSVLIVGCGGLGAPAALYLAAAGVGRLGLVDRDAVEASNLHRQIIHTEAAAAARADKAASAAAAVRALNSSVAVEAYADGLTAANAAGMVARYDVVVDASDNAPTRYLVSDTCVAVGRPLVSAAAVGTDGQLTVYCFGDDGPCYRCLFPEPPAPGNCARCADAGVLGPVPGVMGVLQALEAVKLLSGVGKPLSRQLLLFDALAGRFSSVRLRARDPGCAACGGVGGGTAAVGAAQGAGASAGAAPHPAEDATAGGGSGAACNGGGGGGASAAARAGSGGDSASRGRMTPAGVAAFDYEAFTGQRANDGPPPQLRVLPAEQRLAPAQFAARLGGLPAAAAGAAPAAGGAGGFVLVDVRPREQYDVMHLPGALSMPFESPERFRQHHVPRILELCGAAPAAVVEGPGAAGCMGGGADGAAAGRPVLAPPAQSRTALILCRRGNHSQLAVAALREAGLADAFDLRGGMAAWAAEVDPSMAVL